MKISFYSLRILTRQQLRSLLTISGIALCLLLMLFLLGVYSGVRIGSVEYIRKNEVDLWVLQQNSWNILRASSILSIAHGQFIEKMEGIETVAPVLFILAGVKINGKNTTLFLAGYDFEKALGGPPVIYQGRSIRSEQEIVIDKAYAAKYNLAVGDPIRIHDETFHIVGLSEGTNAFVIQYAFASLPRVQSLIGYPGLVTCFLIKIKPGYSADSVRAAIQEELPGLEVFDHPTFLQNNIHEMESGFLPLLYTVAIIGLVVLTTILSLLLSINILEQRKDFATLKALGSPNIFLWRFIFNQAFLVLGAAFLFCLAAFFPVAKAIEAVVPEISVQSSIYQLIMVALIATAIGCLSALIAIRRIRHIYPLEVFA